VSAVLVAGMVALGVWAAASALGQRASSVRVALGLEPGGGGRGGSGAGIPRPGSPQRWVRAVRSAGAGWLRPAARGEILLVQLTDALAAIASASRAGRSFLQALEVAAEQVPEPLGRELREVVERVRLGAPVEDALGWWAAARPAPEVRLAVGVLRMQRAVGGMVAPALENLARTLRERRAAARELRSLTAQARLSGAILGLLPLGFFCFLWLTSRADMVVALGTPLGRGAVVVGLLLDGLAFSWIRRLLRVEG
jgi:tight adherence protein B